MAKRMPRHIRNQLYANMLKEGKSPEDIAAEMGLSVAYVKSQIRRFSDLQTETGEDGTPRPQKRTAKRKPKPAIEILRVQSALYTSAQLAEKYGVQQSTILNWLRSYGLKALRPKYKRNGPPKKEIDVNYCISRIMHGVPKEQLARQYGMTLATFYKRLKEAGYDEKVVRDSPCPGGVKCASGNKWMKSCIHGGGKSCSYILDTGHRRKDVGEYCVSYEKGKRYEKTNRCLY